MIEIEVESGLVNGDQPCISIKRDAFAKWAIPRPFHETPVAEQERLLNNFKEAMKFQGLAVEMY